MTVRRRTRTSALLARRGLHALLGAVVLLPYLAAGVVLVRTADTAGAATALALTVPAVLAGLGVTVLPGVRELLVAAARSLLDTDLPDTRGTGPHRSGADRPGPPAAFPARLRAAAWLLVCAVLGTVAAAAVLWLLPTAVAMLVAPWRALPPLPTGAAAWWAPPLGIALLPLVVAVPAAIGTGQARLAARFLGPTAAERATAALAARLARAARRAERDAGRARLARELHDSVGHALTVTTLQAGAAAELLDRDPEFVRRALTAIAETGRAALDDLDHVLGLLDSDDPPDDVPDYGPDDPPDAAPDGDPADPSDPAGARAPGDDRAPVPDLAALDALLRGMRATGLDVRADTDPACDVPPAVSREAYRLAQEALTNAARHAAPGPVELVVRRTPDAVELRASSPLHPDPHGSGTHSPGPHSTGAHSTGARGRAGRGLAGAADRVGLFGGDLTAGPDGAHWVLHAVLPVPPPRPGDGVRA